MSELTHVQIRDNLKACLDKNDKIFVGKLSGAAWSLFGAERDQWLVESIK